MRVTPLLRGIATTCLASPLLLALCAAPAAWAQWGGTVSLQSDTRDRGLSYSLDKPQAQLSLDYDGSAGWYGGALLTRSRFATHYASNLVQAYAGRVVGLTDGIDAEAGLQFSSIPSLARYDFAEAYVGLLGARWNARLHYAADYYGTGQQTLYGEFNLNRQLTPTLLAVGHAGLLLGQGSRFDAPQSHRRFDARLGLAWQLRPMELQLAWVTVTPGGPYTWIDEQRRQTFVLGLSTSF